MLLKKTLSYNVQAEYRINHPSKLSCARIIQEVGDTFHSEAENTIIPLSISKGTLVSELYKEYP